MVAQIRELGLPFSDSDIRQALKACKYSQERTTNYLLESSM